MGDSKKAIDRISATMHCYIPSYVVSEEESIKTLYELVEKDTPKEPINIQYNTHGYPLLGNCPICNTLVVAHTGCSNNDCRQRLQWDIKVNLSEAKPIKVTKFQDNLRRECMEDLKKLYGLKPYDGSSNYVMGDSYFGAGIRKKYPSELIEVCKADLGII